MRVIHIPLLEGDNGEIYDIGDMVHLVKKTEGELDGVWMIQSIDDDNVYFLRDCKTVKVSVSEIEKLIKIC